jgi:hypothetical protein
MSPPTPELSHIFALLARSNELCGMLAGWELAAERGNLSPETMKDLSAMRSEEGSAREAAATRWSELPARSPEAVRTYDALVDDLLADARAAPDATFAEGVKGRAPATRSPTRHFDAWAIWGVLRIGETELPDAVE